MFPPVTFHMIGAPWVLWTLKFISSHHFHAYTLLCHTSLFEEFFVFLDYLCSYYYLYTKLFIFAEIFSHPQHPTLIPHDVFYPSWPISGVLFPGRLPWDFWGPPSFFLWHNKSISTNSCCYLFLCVFSPYFFRFHIHLYTPTNTVTDI